MDLYIYIHTSAGDRKAFLWLYGIHMSTHTVLGQAKYTHE
jgi:hypothetical protein